MDRLWKIWYGNYAFSLRERYQLPIKESKKKLSCKPKIGEIVHLKKDSSRSKWKLGKFEQSIQSNDGEIRAAKVRMSNGSLLKRPLNLLYPMELAGTNETNHSNNMAENEEEMEGTNQDNNFDDDIPKRSRSKLIASKNSQANTRLQLCREDN